MCDMLFTETSHPLAEFIFFLDNHCRQWIDMERIYIKISKGIRQNHACEADFLRVIKLLN
ncbi:hypothetical protein YC2023_005971 [Brassica napus]